ncbi:uncharacterized protein LOC127719790 [Mytilus californianus]|uniref:uncharacterized protein LOC127719790 n=1 Tax=Mytilus californianus TaxID=6549 RepID=UPI0022465C96|nr:uncharacterized protein LOC127719790 [Mytilus californianus]
MQAEDSSDISVSTSESDESDFLTQTVSASKRSRRTKKRVLTARSSETDSSNNKLPSTADWNVYFLESLGIFYNEVYHPSPLDILNMIYGDIYIFGPLTDDQKFDMERLQECMTFNSSIAEVMEDEADIVQNADGDIFFPDLENDIENLSSPSLQRAEDFLVNVQLMISCHVAFLNGLTENEVPEDMFVNILEAFSNMCHILPVPGSAFKSKKIIQNVPVTSSPHVVLIPWKNRLISFAEEAACIVSVAQVQKEKQAKKSQAKWKNTEPTKFSQDLKHSSDCGSKVSQVPLIFEKVHGNILGQHGGELLINEHSYGSILSKGRILKYLPGIICIGTEVIFTLLKINSNHLRELKTKSKTVRQDTKATIYYSEPKDLLRKVDRDILIESFIRLNNICKIDKLAV